MSSNCFGAYVRPWRKIDVEFTLLDSSGTLDTATARTPGIASSRAVSCSTSVAVFASS